MLHLTAANQSFDVGLAGATTTNPVVGIVSYSGYVAASALTPGQAAVNFSATGPTILLAGPASGSYGVNDISLFNADTASATISFYWNNNGTRYKYWTFTLAAGERASYDSSAHDWTFYDANGAHKVNQVAYQIARGTGNVTINSDGSISVNPTSGTDVTLTGGRLLFSIDNAWDIGTSGATRPRRVYAGTEVLSPLFTGALTGNVTGNVSGSSGSTTGNAATATALQTARTINGVSFDGTSNITVAAAAGTLTGATLTSGVTASSLTTLGTLAGHLLFTDNTYDIGASGATRPRDLNLGRNALIGGGINVGSTAAPWGKCDVQGYIRSYQPTGTIGTGVEIIWDSDGATGYVQCLDHDSITWKPLVLRGNTVSLGGNGATNSLTVDASGNTLIGGNVQIGSTDVILQRDAANILALRNSTNAQAFRVYNTYTDSSNGEWGALRWNSNVLEIGTYANGTGTVRTVQLVGLVGIGVMPQEVLHIYRAANTYLKIDAPNASQVAINFAKDGTKKWTLYVPASSGDLRLFDEVGGIHRITIQQTGNVGIGTTSPGFLLDVNGVANVVTELVTAGHRVAYLAKSSNYTLTQSDCVVFASGNTTLTLPTAVGRAGKVYFVKKTDTVGTSITIATTSSQTIDGSATATLSTQYATTILLSDGANWGKVTGLI